MRILKVLHRTVFDSVPSCPMLRVVTIIGSENTMRCYLSVLDHFSPHIRGDTLDLGR